MNQPSPDPISAWNVILTLGIVISIVTNIVLALRTGKTQSRDVTILDGGVSQVEFRQHQEENKKVHDQLFATASGKERGLREEMGKAIQDLRGDLTDTSNTMHELKGEMKQLGNQLVLVQQELQNR